MGSVGGVTGAGVGVGSKSFIDTGHGLIAYFPLPVYIRISDPANKIEVVATSVDPAYLEV